MSNPAKRKGSAWELAVARYMGAERQYGAGRHDDVGDINGVPEWALECKDAKTFNLPGWVDEAIVEAANAHKPYGAVVIKRPRHAVSDGYVLMPLFQFRQLLEDYQ